jgi:hypothetical protein
MLVLIHGLVSCATYCRYRRVRRFVD